MKTRKMAIEIKEYVGHVFTNVNQSKTDLSNLKEAHVVTYVDEDSLMVDIEAIHSRVTRNNTYYSPECLKESIPYWTAPYERPVIMHHNEKDGVIIGRVKAAEYTETDTRSETPALLLTANIGDEEGKKGIKNGTLSTVSIGVIAHDLRCSICGQNLAEEGACEHERGEVYVIDGEQKLCYWIINKMEPKEVSYVIVPSDIYAHNIRVYPATNKKKGEVKESVDNYNPFQDLLNSTKEIVDSIQESASTQEGTQVDEEVKDGQKAQKPDVTPEDNTEDKTEGENKEPENKDDNKAPQTDDSKEGEAEEDKKKPEGEEPEGKDNKDEADNKDDESKKSTEDDENKDESEELKAAKQKIVELEKEIATLKADKTKLTKKAEDEKKLRESAEIQLVEYKAKEKKSLAEQVNTLRTNLHLAVLEESALLESSEVELKATIKQLNEFTQAQKQVFGVQTITSPVAVSEAQDNTSKENNKVTDVKESTESSNKSLEDQYIDLFKNIF